MDESTLFPFLTQILGEGLEGKEMAIYGRLPTKPQFPHLVLEIQLHHCPWRHVRSGELVVTLASHYSGPAELQTMQAMVHKSLLKPGLSYVAEGAGIAPTFRLISESLTPGKPGSFGQGTLKFNFILRQTT